MTRLGLELTPAVIRGVWMSSFTRRPVAAFETPWDPAEPAVAVTALMAAHRAPDDISIAIGLGFLHVARVSLPPAPDAAREEMLALEPDRHFPTNDPLQVALAPGSDVAFAVNAAWLAHVCEAFARWAPVSRVEAAPLALVASGCPDGDWGIDAADGETGVVSVRNGRLAGARRLAGSADDTLRVPSARDGTPALGAVLREDAGDVGVLLPPEARRAMRGRQRRTLAVAVTAAAAAIVFLLGSLDRARERTLASLQAEAEQLAAEATPALEAHAALLRRATARQVMHSTLGDRPDIAGALAALGQVLPGDVVVTAVRATGRELQLEGTARDAGALVPLLDADPRFDNVRSLAANARFRDGRETRESFAIALHASARD